MVDEKLKEVWNQIDREWTGSKAFKQLHKITPIPKKYVKSLLEKQAFCQVRAPPPKEIKKTHHGVTKPNE